MANCRSCNAPIMWGKTTNGKAVPLDTKPKNVYILLNADEGVYSLERGYESHFATCPNADQHRGKK